jgi:hypothetical protein
MSTSSRLTHPFSLPTEEVVLGLEKDVLGSHFTEFCLGSLSSECTRSAISISAVNDLGLHKDPWTNEIRAQLPDLAGIQDSLVHIITRPRVCGIFGDSTRVYAFTTKNDTLHCGLCDSGANLCMTNNPNLLMDVHPCAPLTILLATTNRGQSHTNVCRRHGLLPLPLLNGSTYYQTCFVNPYASETFISPQAIIDSSAGSFNKWQMEGFLQGHPGILSLYSPSGLLKMSIQLSQQDGLYYSSTDTYTVDTNPQSWYSPFFGSAFTELPPDLHLIDNDNSSDCSDTYNDVVTAVANHATTPGRTITSDATDKTHCPPCIPAKSTTTRPTVWQPTLPRSRVLVRPTNLTCQLESELWAACLGHCGKDQLHSLATHVNGLPNSFEFHPFCHIDWKEQAQTHKQAVHHLAQKVEDTGARFYMDFGFIRASSVDYCRPTIRSNSVVKSYNGYSSYLLIVDDKSSKSWVFLTRSKSPPLDIVRLFLSTFGHDQTLGGFIRCNQGGELA